MFMFLILQPISAISWLYLAWKLQWIVSLNIKFKAGFFSMFDVQYFFYSFCCENAEYFIRNQQYIFFSWDRRDKTPPLYISFRHFRPNIWYIVDGSPVFFKSKNKHFASSISWLNSVHCITRVLFGLLNQFFLLLILSRHFVSRTRTETINLERYLWVCDRNRRPIKLELYRYCVVFEQSGIQRSSISRRIDYWA